jgi:hypothetical protein
MEPMLIAPPDSAHPLATRQSDSTKTPPQKHVSSNVPQNPIYTQIPSQWPAYRHAATTPSLLTPLALAFRSVLPRPSTTETTPPIVASYRAQSKPIPSRIIHLEVVLISVHNASFQIPMWLTSLQITPPGPVSLSALKPRIYTVSVTPTTQAYVYAYRPALWLAQLSILPKTPHKAVQLPAPVQPYWLTETSLPQNA